MGNRIERRMRRRLELARPIAEREVRPQQCKIHPDGIGYSVLHPTKGWRRISAIRAAAQIIMARKYNKGPLAHA